MPDTSRNAIASLSRMTIDNPPPTSGEVLTATSAGTSSWILPVNQTIQVSDVPVLNQDTTGNSATSTNALSANTATYATTAGTATALSPTVATPKNTSPANPSTTTSTALVMAGTGTTASYTPALTGNVLVCVSGLGVVSGVLGNISYGGRYGTGTAPANGVAATGTRFGSSTEFSLSPVLLGTGSPFSFSTVLTGLTAGTAYWFDLAFKTSGVLVVSGFTNLQFTFVELH